MTVREHLQKAHAAHAAGDRADAAHHRTMSKCHSAAMGKAVDGDPNHAFHKAAAAAHDAAAEAKDASAEKHDAMCEECSKAADGDLNKLVPTEVSAITPDRPRITPVLRPGQPPIQTTVDPQLAKIGGIAGEDMDSEEVTLR